MNGRGPQRAEAEGLPALLRPLRLAAASLAEPLGAALATIAGAETATSALRRTPDLASFSPFAAIGEIVAAGADAGSGPADGRSKRKAAPSRAAGKAATRGAAAPASTLGAGGAALGAAAAAGAAGGGLAAAAGAVAAAGSAGAAAGKAGGAGSAAAGGAKPPAEAAPADDCCETVLELVESLVDEVERLEARDGGAPGAARTRRATSAAPTPGGGSSEGIAIDDTAGGQGYRVPAAKPGAVSTADVASGERISVDLPPTVRFGSDADAGPAAQPADSGASPFDVLRRALLATPFETAAGEAPQAPAAGPGAATRAPAPPSGPVPVPYPATTPSAFEPKPPPAQLEPGELAWLVNEALVEQARRHGVDLS